MQESLEKRWNERYKQAEYAYGTAPNFYFQTQLSSLTPGKILMPADGEGRNGVFAAESGWDVEAFDLSEEGKNKAMALANSKNVKINYQVGEFMKLNYLADSFDAIGLIYAHFPAEPKAEYHRVLSGYLKPGGYIIFEAFSKNHLEYQKKFPGVGGPKEEGMLFSAEEINAFFPDFEFLELKEEVIELSEGAYHQGKGSVIRFVGRKR